jgi:outer membrane protein OmpA-like peptidoglycan-associated protein
MASNHDMTRTLLRLTLPLLLLGAPAAAVAQPADDPGLEAAPAPPQPTARNPQPTATPAPSPATTNAPSVPVAAMPAAAGTEEHVETKVAYGPGAAGVDLYERTAAPMVAGPIGLLRTITGDAGRGNNFRVSLHLQAFQQDDFLVSGANGLKGDSNSRFVGDLTIDYTPWKYLELYLSLLNSSNQNTRPETPPARTDPEVILSLGDVAAGVKGRLPVTPWLDLAVHLGLRFFNSVSAVSVDGAATNFSPDLIASFDLRHAAATRRVPLRFHINFGYLLDNSIHLLPKGLCAGSTSNDACIRSRVVETFAYGIGASRFRLAGAVDAPIALLAGRLGIEPFFEYHAEVAIGDGDQTVLKALRNDPAIQADRITGNSLQYLTFGVRVRPVGGLVLDAGLDVGLSSPGFQYGPPVPQWNVILGATYAYDPTAGRSKVVTRTVTRETPEPTPVVEGKLRGVVRDAQTKKPIGGATVRYVTRRANPQLTADDGSFVSYGFAPGPISLEVSRDDYDVARVDSVIPANGETPVEVLLTAKPPANGVLRGHVTDSAGAPVANATARLTNSASGAVIDAESEGAGGFVAKLPAGDYLVDVGAEGYLSRTARVAIAAGQPQTMDVVLHKKPARSHVSISKGEIKIRGTIHFGTNNAKLRPDGEQIVDEVADLLTHHPEIKKVRVEGHTDNRGNAQHNLKLSKARAAAVVAYLIKQGIDPARLESEGYGSTRPLVPNITAAQRAKNRRVAFKILENAR